MRFQKGWSSPYLISIFAKTSGGNGRSELKGPPGAAYIRMKEIMTRISNVGMATASLRTRKLNMRLDTRLEEAKKKLHAQPT